MNYYQYSKTNKKLISIDISFDDLKTLTTAEKDGEIDVPYNLTFNFAALSHTDLTIAFAFEWHFYLVLYLIIGTLSIFIIIVFLCYHRIMTRGKAASFKFFSNLKLMLPPAAYGVTIAMFPLVLINLFIAVFMVGSVLEYDFKLFPCDSQVDSQDCPFSLFDWIKDDPNNVDVDYDLLRSGRSGIAFCIVGAYLMWLGLKILIPEKSERATNFIVESYDGNVWEFFTWKRSNVLFISIFWIFYNLMVIQFSFSETFGLYIWYMIGLIKVLGVVFGFILEVLLEESLLSSPMEILGGLTQGLVTFGADDFVDFLSAYFIELGIMMFERTYVGDFVDYCVKYIESRMQKLINFRLGWFSSNDDFLLDKEARKQKEAQERKKREQEEADLLREDKEPEKEEDKKKEENKGDFDAGSSGSDIYISDDEDDFDFDDSDNLDDSDQFLDYNDSLNEGDKAKPVEKKQEGEKEGKDEESDLPIDENIEVQEVEPLLESFKNYANDTIVLFINPLFIALIWVFYDETQVAAEYGIRTQDFLYYFMFSVVIIPFQIVIDVFFQNIVEWYFRLPVHDYLDYLHFRFASRTTRWKGNEEIPNLQVGMNLVSLDQLCFSSQYYFVQTIYSFGMTQLMLGIQILLNFPTYNAFSDNALLIVIVVIIAVCFIIQRLCIILGTLLRIWKVKETKSNRKKEMTLKEQFLRLLNVDQYMKSKGIKLSPVELHFSKAKWDIVEKLRAQDEVALVDLKTDRIVARTVRDKFIRFNKPWLRDNMHEIFTPRTLFLYRKEIINQFEKVVGKRQPVNISLSSKEKSTDSKDASDHNDSRYYKNFKPKYMTEKTKEIIRFWINNARITKLLRQKALQNKGMVKSNIKQPEENKEI